jgi:cell division protein FtsB
MEGFLWVLPALGCGLMILMMVVMMFGMGKSMFSRDKQDDESEGASLDELRAEQKRMAEEIERLEARDATSRERAPSPTGG